MRQTIKRKTEGSQRASSEEHARGGWQWERERNSLYERDTQLLCKTQQETPSIHSQNTATTLLLFWSELRQGYRLQSFCILVPSSEPIHGVLNKLYQFHLVIIQAWKHGQHLKGQQASALPKIAREAKEHNQASLCKSDKADYEFFEIYSNPRTKIACSLSYMENFKWKHEQRTDVEQELVA